MGTDNAEDIKTVINFMASQPTVDASRVVVVGQSFGGWNTLALGTDPIDIQCVRLTHPV